MIKHTAGNATEQEVKATITVYNPNNQSANKTTCYLLPHTVLFGVDIQVFLN